MSDRERTLVARAAEVSEHLDTVVTLFGRVGDLSILPGPEALQALGENLALVAADLLARAQELDHTIVPAVATRAAAALEGPAPRRGTEALRSPRLSAGPLLPGGEPNVHP